MAFVSNSAHAAAGKSLTERVSDMFAGLIEAQEKRATYRRTLRELEALSNRELADLGLSRSGIRRVALEAAYNV